ncbi:MAG: hypothetical protein GY760_18625 [Deltaproteobacteria bacterium]|nr:hypothetical protein [Deltaproteobacteria bacterium]
MSLTPQFGSLKPSQKQEILNSNYLKFNDGAGAGNTDTFAQQYLPEIYEQEVERYGNRTLSGFLRMVGAEMPMTSDQVIWSEQNRLHISYEGCTSGVSNNVSTISIPLNLTPTDPKDYVANVVSPGATIVAMDSTGFEIKCVVTASNLSTGALTVSPYSAQTIAGLATSGVKIFVFGSEYAKGSSTPNSTVTAGAADGYVSIDPSFTQFSNSPVIIRNKYVVNGSDMAQIGWVEVATEDGTSGYLWYLKAESETRLRFEDYLEMSVVEGEKATGTGAGSAANAGYKGTQGLFAAIEDRGNVNVGFTAAAGLDTFDDILKNLDTQGAIEENMLFLQRQTSLDFDDMLAGVGAADNGIYAGGSSYGVFENSEDMALNLGFSGFRRGSYDFYKTDWKYLNDASLRGLSKEIDGVMIPAGTTTVYDQMLGSNIRRPFLHVRYRASETEDRRMKSWVTGSVGGAYTDTLDAMTVSFLSERCLVTQAANNFVLFKGA